jgi:hypothetical protein
MPARLFCLKARQLLESRVDAPQASYDVPDENPGYDADRLPCGKRVEATFSSILFFGVRPVVRQDLSDLGNGRN